MYLEHVTQTDTDFGTVMSALDANGYADHTAVFVSSDHGDFAGAGCELLSPPFPFLTSHVAGDHHLVEKWPGGMNDILTRVPFIAHVPGMPGGRVTDAPIQLFDIVATFAELAHVNVTHTHFSKSLMPIISGESDGDRSRLVFSEGGYVWPTELEPLNGGAVWTDKGNDHEAYWWVERGRGPLLSFMPPTPLLRSHTGLARWQRWRAAT